MLAEPYSLLRDELWWRLLPLLAALCAFAAAAFATGRLLASRVMRRRLLPLGVRGTSEMEFALAFPIFLVSVFVTVQLALMVNATLVVDYAAFCAARSAAVWVPKHVSDREPAGEVTPYGSGAARNSEKWGRIRRSAVLAVIPISPRISRFRFGFNIPREAPPFDARELANLASKADAGIGRRARLDQLAVAIIDKWPYAYFFTDVQLLGDDGRAATRFSGTVTARVTHNFEMAVPFAGQAMGAFLGRRYIPLFGGYYVPISASYTLAMGGS